MNQDAFVQAQLAQISPLADLFPGLVLVHNLRSQALEYLSAPGLQALGATLPALRALGPRYPQAYLHPRDAASHATRLAALLRPGAEHEVLTLFQQVRTSGPPDYAWHLSTARLFGRDAAGRPLLALCFAYPLSLLSQLNPKIGYLLEEQSFMRQHQPLFGQLTRRERQVLQLLAQGKDSATIAGELFISPHTVATHRRNINGKLRPRTRHELARYAQAFDLGG